MRPLAIILVLSGMLAARAAEPANTLDRVIEAASKSPGWKDAKTQADRLVALREQALKYEAVSDLVSDRYLITALGGPVDLVRFFGLARTVCGGSMERRAALLQQWQRETKGIKAGTSEGAEIFPDDLPSNALGALFGEDLKPHNASLNYDLVGALRKFLGALDPVPDEVTAKFPHARLVHGLDEDANAEAKRASGTWLTAEPLYILPVVAPDKAKTLPNASAALKAAGLLVRQHQSYPIVIDRVGTPEPVVAPGPKGKPTPPGIVMRVPANEESAAPPATPEKEPASAKAPGTTGDSKFPKAVPVDDYPKAVPVKETPAKKPSVKKQFPRAVPVE